MECHKHETQNSHTRFFFAVLLVPVGLSHRLFLTICKAHMFTCSAVSQSANKSKLPHCHLHQLPEPSLIMHLLVWTSHSYIVFYIIKYYYLPPTLSRTKNQGIYE